MNIFSIFQETCRKFPNKICIKSRKGDLYESFTYSKLYDEVCVLRSELIRSGIKPGSRVAFLISNSQYWPVAFFASMSVQAVAVPIDVQLSSEEVREIIIHSAAKILLTEDKFGVALSSVISVDDKLKVFFVDRAEEYSDDGAQEIYGHSTDFGEDKLAVLFYTSGTTKERKAVMLTHKNLLSNVSSIDALSILKQDDVIVSLLPLHHAYPFMITCLVPFLKGYTVCYFPNMAHHELFNAMRENKATVFVGVPQIFSLIERSIIERMKKYGAIVHLAMDTFVDLCSGLSVLTGKNICKIALKGLHAALGPDLRLMTSGGAKLDPEVAKNFARWGFNIIEGYGLTETSPVVSFTPPGLRRHDSVGKAIPGVEIKILSNENEKIGEVAIKGDNVMLGYYRNLSLSRSVLKDGLFFTGDLGFLDKEGLLHLTGRSDELIVFASGKKINPEDIESNYLKSPYIKEICVMQDEAAGGHLVAVVVPDEDRMRAHKYINMNFKIKWELDACSQRLAPYQRIKGFVLTGEAFPRTRLGKLIRYKIKQKYASGYFNRAEKKELSVQLSHFEEAAVGYLSNILKKNVSIDDHLELDLGLDSLGRIELLSALQDLVNVGIDDNLALELFQARTVRDLISKARQALPENAFLGFVKREDTVFWPHVLFEPLSEENKKKLKMSFDWFDRAVTFLEIMGFKFLFRTLFSLRVEGKENLPKDGPFILAPNHVSYLDAFYCVCAMPFSLILKTYFVGFGTIFGHPLISWGVRFHRLVPIDADLNLAEALRTCSFILKNGKCLVYFPEGQRSADGELKEFRKGIGILLKETNAKVVPVYIEGAYAAWPRSRPIPLPANITVKIGKPYKPSDVKLQNADDPYVELAADLRERVSKLKG